MLVGFKWGDSPFPPEPDPPTPPLKPVRPRFHFEETVPLLPRRSGTWRSLQTSAAVSLVVHAVLLMAMSLIIFNLPTHEMLDSFLTMVMASSPSQGNEIDFELTAEPIEIDEASEPSEPSDTMQEEVSSEFELELSLPINLGGAGLAVVAKPEPVIKKIVPPSAPGKDSPKKGTGQAVAESHEDHFVGRSPAARSALLRRMGGTDASEAAVARGLVWLKVHQLPNGSWNFDHTLTPECTCTMPGRLSNNPNGATAMALLAFLGAGKTQIEGEYQTEVRKGLDFLLANGTPVGKGICYYGALTGPPTFYTQGLVTIALSEAFAMTHEPELRTAVAGSIEFLVATQHQQGGWRYFPGQPGDTSVVAWELMALKSAQFSRISVPPKVFGGIERFLASASSMRGSRYAYLPDRKNNPTPSMTAAGLLCRMYLDWKDTNVGLKAGVNFLDEHGPDPYDMYYNYYATQVLHHWGGEEWDRWNPKMRDFLVDTQIRRTHAAGSWDVADRHGNMGGRLYMTTLALLTLEVYYRHLPLYQKDRIEIPLKVAE